MGSGAHLAVIGFTNLIQFTLSIMTELNRHQKSISVVMHKSQQG